MFMISPDVSLVCRCLEYEQVCREMLTELESAKQARRSDMWGLYGVQGFRFVVAGCCGFTLLGVQVSY